MIPKAASEVIFNLKEDKEGPSKTYYINTDKDRINGNTDGLEAMKQAVYLILNTDRYQYLIYSWNYGIELADLLGKPIPYVLPELRRRVTEALLQDRRITGVDAFSFKTDKRSVHMSFTVHTIFGDVEGEKAVVV